MKINILIVSLLCVSCANVYFDNLEYDKLISIYQRSKSETCEDKVQTLSTISSINNISKNLKIYISNKSGREWMVNSVSILDTTIDSFLVTLKTGKITQEYCKQKMENISQEALLLLQQEGKL